MPPRFENHNQYVGRDPALKFYEDKGAVQVEEDGYDLTTVVRHELEPQPIHKLVAPTPMLVAPVRAPTRIAAPVPRMVAPPPTGLKHIFHENIEATKVETV